MWGKAASEIRKDRRMTKKVSIILSVILFLILIVLFACEIKWPEAGAALINSLLH